MCGIVGAVSERQVSGILLEGLSRLEYRGYDSAGMAIHDGDAVISKGANIGAGTIICNYDGVNRSLTEIGDNAFIGSNSSLVAPVKVGAVATIGSGSTITSEVGDEELSVARGKQRNIAGWQRPVKKS